VADFTFKHVRALCQLAYGETIPKLEDALRVAVNETTLRGVWLDIKTPETVIPAVQLAKELLKEAKEKGRKISIVAGLGDQDVYDAFLSAGYAGQVPCLVELEPNDVIQAGCKVFGPRWTRGPMPDIVAQMQASGHLVAFWTLDEVDFIDLFLKATSPNGILTNRPGLVVHRFEMVGKLPPSAEDP
jgi:glycerophosphoryl diester phosphodiesterase